MTNSRRSPSSIALWERPKVSTLAAAARKVGLLSASMSNEGSLATLLNTAGADPADVSVWKAVRGPKDPLWSLTHRLRVAAEVWDGDMALRDAMRTMAALRGYVDTAGSLR